MQTLVTGALQATEEELDALRRRGLALTVHQDERRPVEHPERYALVICNGLFQYQDIAAFSALRFVQLTSAGYDRMPMDYARAHGITVRNAAGVYSIPMAEWTLMRILELYKHAGALYARQAERRWEKDRSWQELAGRRACIVGFGAYGQETARRLKAFDVHITAVNRTPRESPYLDRLLSLDRLEEGLAEADIVVMAAALTPETRQLMGRRQFSIMKPGALLINAARGGLVDEEALLEALSSGRLAGAALDVFAQEPLPEDSPLRRQKTVLLSSHNAFVGEQNHRRLYDILCQNLSSFLR